MTRSCRVTLTAALVASLGLIAAPATAADAKPKPTVPGVPTITGFTQGKRSVTVSFTPPATDGGSAIFAYRVTCRPVGGGETKLGYSHASPVIVIALAARKSYVCTLAARNRVGFGAPSASIALNVNGGTTCSSSYGTAAFTPPLPRITDRTTVDTVLTTSGTLGDCVGGGVTGGTLTTGSVPIVKVNCSAFLKGIPKPISATGTITWNTNATSTLAFQIEQVKGKITQTTIRGTVSAGQFLGLHISGLSGYIVPGKACASASLSTLTYKQLRAWDIT